VHKYAQQQKVFESRLTDLMIEADQLRTEHPGCGVEKMYYTLLPDFIGRDKFIEIFMQSGYRLHRKKNYRKTTRSASIYYPNLIEGMVIIAPSEVWQSDITYIDVGGKFYYAVFIIDVYTRKIVGYHIGGHMRATANMAALYMALKSHKAPRIHHSDRGAQYIYKQYLLLLRSRHSKISMGLCAQDNAYAERINRTIKEEYLDHWKPRTLNQLTKQIKKAVDHYNNKRIHNSLNRKCPAQYLKDWKTMDEHSKPLLTIFKKEIIP
jgi:transposase InsO family protein